MTLVTRRYTFKLYPTKAQEAVLNEQARLCAHLWNAALEQREIQWAHECQRKPKGERKGLGQFDQHQSIKIIRREDERFAMMSSQSLYAVLENLDLAFKAFFQRAKSGAGISSGYPRYKRTNAASTVPYKKSSGWRIERFEKYWKIYAKGVPGLIKARGRFPTDPAEIRTMELIRRDGAWWSSIVVKMEARLVAGSLPIEVDFNLIDEFASVKNRSNGECLAGPQGRITRRDDRWRTSSGSSDDDRWRTSSDSSDDDRQFDKFNCSPRGVVSSNSDNDDKEFIGVANTDEIQSDRDRRFKKFSNRWRREKKRIARLKAKEARQRREALHLWTTNLIRQANDVLVIAPSIRDATKSAKGDERNPGAAVATVALLNRYILSQAPAAAIRMLEYKAAEAGIQFTRITPAEHATTIGHEISQATKTARKASRIIRKEAA